VIAGVVTVSNCSWPRVSIHVSSYAAAPAVSGSAAGSITGASSKPEVLTSPDLRAGRTKEIAHEFLRKERLRELSDGLYLFTKGLKHEQTRS
jgi:hypothetical protein